MEDNDKTRLIRRPSTQPPALPPEAASHPEDPDQTRILGRPEPEATPAHVQADDDKTVILSPPARAHVPSDAPLSDAMSDPLVGWLVIIAGPGQGNALRLGHGMNSIGRADNQRCRIDYGDVEISRKTHASVTYDPKGRKFYLMHGGGQNLTYLGDQPVLAPAILNGGELIFIGKTTLKFIPLCGPDFDWS